ncbi:MAG TPA: indole-3-glycerol phosphate synthase TrpC [Acidimicrobiia bacterium]|nr:indole-3-glycerol phosphate synthase TrpC [Acidimicrobiia bacterium]
MTFLSTILESKRVAIENLPALEELEQRAAEYERSDVRIPVWGENLDVIAEIKRRSPSKGELATIEDAASLARIYDKAGAVIISVLTDHDYFGARPDDFDLVRNAVSIPVLRKDFIIDIRQVFETYLMGADVMLLIVAAFEDQGVLRALHDCAKSLGMSVLVETHSLAELEVAHKIDAQIVGVNVRDLATFDENPDLGDEVLSHMDSEIISVWESSIVSVNDALRARAAGADAVLVGQALVQHADPADFISQIRNIS